MRACFDNFVFDTGTRRFSRAGAEVHLSPKAFQLLELLIERAPDAVSQEEVYDALWPDTVVNLANLHNLILQIRSALGEESRSRIRTVYGYGFSFTGDLRNEGTPAVRELSRFLLLVGLGPGTGLPQDLREGDNLIGRDEQADVRMLLPSVSRRHATIRIRDEEAVLEDLSSKNGTYLEGRRLHEPAALRAGSTLAFGQVMSRFLRSDTDDSTITEISQEF